MIQLSNNHSFTFMAASGALGYDGGGWPWEWPMRWIELIQPELFTIVTKSLTLKTRQGNLRWYKPWDCTRLIKNGTVNAVGLTNPGIDWWLEKIYPRLLGTKRNVIISLAAEMPREYVTMTEKLYHAIFLKGIEINASCPNSTGELQGNTEAVVETVKAVKEKTDLPVLLKLSCTHDYVAIAKRLEGVVEAININSIPWKEIFTDQSSPLARFGGGGVSGKVTQDKNWEMVKTLARATTIPVVGPGVWEFTDMEKLFQIGAKAIAFGSIFLRYPWRPTAFVKRYRTSHS